MVCSLELLFRGGVFSGFQWHFMKKSSVKDSDKCPKIYWHYCKVFKEVLFGVYNSFFLKPFKIIKKFFLKSLFHDKFFSSISFITITYLVCLKCNFLCEVYGYQYRHIKKVICFFVAYATRFNIFLLIHEKNEHLKFTTYLIFFIKPKRILSRIF